MKTSGLLAVTVVLAMVIWGSSTNWWRGDGSVNESRFKYNSAIAKEDKSTAQSKIKISIENFSLSPTELRVKKGTTVVWVNNDYEFVAHQLKSDKNLFISRILKPGEKFEYTFQTPGEYSYRCLILPGTKGKIIVTDE